MPKRIEGFCWRIVLYIRGYRLFYHLVQRHALGLRRQRQPAVQLRRDAHIEHPAVFLLRLLADLRAEHKVIVRRLLKRGFDALGIFRVEIDQIVYAEDFSVEYLVLDGVFRLRAELIRQRFYLAYPMSVSRM